MQCQIPYEAGSRIIGKAGATIKRLQATVCHHQHVTACSNH